MSTKGIKQSEEWIRKRVEARKAKDNYHLAKEVRLKISEAQKGRKAWNKGLTKYNNNSMLKLSSIMLNHDFDLIRDKEWLLKKYEEECFTTTEIAKMVGCCATTVTQHLKSFDIPIRSNRASHLVNKESIKKLNNQKFLYQKYTTERKSCQKIGNEIGCSTQTVSRALKRYDIEMRPIGESLKGKIPWMRGKHFSDESRRKWFKSNTITPNKQEIRLQKLLDEILPNEYKFVGDGEFILGGRCPDYLNVNGQKKLIELYGDFWHKGEDGIERIEYFKSFGFETLIVWEHELKNSDLLISKINRFNEHASHKARTY